MTQQLQINLDRPDYLAGVSEDKILEAADAILRRRMKFYGDPMTAPETVKRWLRTHLQTAESERFGVIWLNTRHHVIEAEDLFFGTIDGAAVYPREVVRSALKHNAAACIVYHNHPSGTAEPSKADETLTERLQSSLGLIDVRVLDHVLVAGEEIASFAEKGLM